MNIKYWFEFKGLDEVLNRVEILTDSNVIPEEVQVPDGAFSLQYLTVKKLDVVQGSQATLRLTSRKIFEFIGLHTDDMQEYMIRFYRAGRLYWLGFLDSELYSENLTDYPPYPVEFAGADFNIMKRLKYRDEAGNRYTDVVPFITHLKRCFDLLGLPFDKLYIGCTTVANDVPASPSETALHVLYMMSANFYDEDNEPMTCREVVENILRPFGLMMVQKNGSVFIYDYNTVKLGLPMKRYHFASWAYEAEETVNFDLGDISDIKTLTTDASFGFEEMINNVQITSSLYAENMLNKVSVSEETLSEETNKESNRQYNLYYYNKCENIENVAGKYVRYVRDGESDITGGELIYSAKPPSISPIFRVKASNYLIETDSASNLNVKLKAYANTRENPFNANTGIQGNKQSGAIKLYCNLYIVDNLGKPISYCDLEIREGAGRPDAQVNPDRIRNYWKESTDGSLVPGKFILWLSNEDIKSSVLDNWVTNANKLNPTDDLSISVTIPSTLVGKGINIPVKYASGYLVFEITNKCRIVNPQGDDGVSDNNLLPEGNIKNILINDIVISLTDKKGDVIPTDDYIFKSYVNKKVATDFKNIDLKCISANEENLPIGKANILKKMDNSYKLQLSFTRGSQTNILERLLMCTIHSNHTKKNVSISVTVKMTENPTLSYCTYKNVIHSDGMYITGATLDFYNATATIKAEEFSADDARISDIPYD